MEVGTSVKYKITDGHCVPPSGNHMKGNNLEEDQQLDGENQTSTGRTPSGRGYHKTGLEQDAEAIGQPQEMTAAQ